MPVKHELCGKSHSKLELLDKCEVRHSLRLIDEVRRARNAELIPPAEYIRQRRYEGMSFDKVTAGLKRDYPPPPPDLVRSWEGWSVGNVIELDTRRFSWGPLAVSGARSAGTAVPGS